MKISKQIVPARFPCNYIHVLYISGCIFKKTTPPPLLLRDEVMFGFVHFTMYLAAPSDVTSTSCPSISATDRLA